MKKLLTIAFALVLGATLSFAQASTPAPADKPATTTKTKSTKKAAAKKSSKKAKKPATDSTAAPK